MSFNLLDIAKGYVTEAVVGKLASSLGQDSSLITKAVGAALPSLLGGVINSGSSSSGLSSIMNVLNNQDDSVLDNLGDILGNSDKSSGLMNAGGGILSSLLGDKLGGIVNAVSSFSGLGGSATSSIFSFLAPVLMGALGKKVKSDGLGVSGLGDLLSSQKDLVSKALPSGMGSILGFADNSVGDTIKSVGAEMGESSFNWKPWLLGLLALLAAWFLFKKCSGEAKDAVDTTVAAVDSVSSNVDTVASAVGATMSKLGAMVDRALPDGSTLNVPENGIESKLVGFITDNAKMVDKTTWFDFDRINFATGSADLTPESAEQVKNIAGILKAYPKVKLKIGGYTDNVGDAESNLKLSAIRAASVMKALVGNGIDKSRLAAEGYGAEHPVASNDTEEGKAQNRRIAVRVTEK